MNDFSMPASFEWKQFVSGDADSFTQLFQHFSKPLFNYGVKVVNDEELVKECLQDLFLTLWKSRSKLAVNVVSVQSYLFLSFKRLLLRRQKQTARLINFNKRFAESFTVTYSIEQAMVDRETVSAQEQLIAGALGLLSERQKEAIYLKYYHTMSYEEIGEIMGINYQSLRTLVYKGIKQMHHHLTTNGSQAGRGASLRSILSLFTF
jgi:RNA polymerase sigma factor (sigma-70 family)